MNEKPFTDYFKTPRTPFGAKEWDEIAQGKKISFILMSARCGSTYIYSILEEMKDMGSHLEFFNEEASPVFNQKNFCFKNFIKKLVTENAINNVFSVKSEWYHFYNCINKNLIDPAFFKNKNVKFYILLRRNIILQAISHLQAIDTGVWHIFNNSNLKNLESFKNSTEIDNERIFYFIKTILEREIGIFNFVSQQEIKPVVFFYEDLISNPFTVIEKLYRDVDICFDVNKFNSCLKSHSLTKKIERQNTPLIYLNFIKKYPFFEEFVNLRNQNFAKLISDRILPKVVSKVDIHLHDFS